MLPNVMYKGFMPGTHRVVRYYNDPGNLIIDEDLNVKGDGYCENNLRVDGRLILGDLHEIDVLTTTIYRAQDPIIQLNREDTTPDVTESGLQIFRGETGSIPNPLAKLFYTDDGSGNWTWKAGLGSNIYPILRIENNPSNKTLLFWDDDIKISKSIDEIRYLNISSPTRIVSTIPFYWTLPLNNKIKIRSTNITSSILDILRFAGSTTFSKTNFGFFNLTYDWGELLASPQYRIDSSTNGQGIEMMEGKNILYFNVSSPINPRTKFIFGQDGISIGKDDDDAALIQTDQTILRIESSNTTTPPTPPDSKICFRIGSSSSIPDQMCISHDEVTINVPFHPGNMEVEELKATKYTYTQPVGFNFFPTIAGWNNKSVLSDNGGPGSVDCFLDANINQLIYKYELKITYTLSPGVSGNFTIHAIINLGTYSSNLGQMENIRSIYGVKRRYSTDGTSIIQVYGIPPNDIYIEQPYDLRTSDPVGSSPYTITTAMLSGYHILSINASKEPHPLNNSKWEAIITIELKLP